MNQLEIYLIINKIYSVSCFLLYEKQQIFGNRHLIQRKMYDKIKVAKHAKNRLLNSFFSVSLVKILILENHNFDSALNVLQQ